MALIYLNYLNLCFNKNNKLVNPKNGIKNKINELKLAKLQIIDGAVDLSKTKENEIKMNIINNIYEERELNNINQNELTNDL